MSAFRRLAVIAAASLSLSACIGPFEPCDDVGNFGVKVTVVDSASGLTPKLGTSAFLILTEGAYTETAQASVQIANSPLVLAGALERPGTYALEVRMTGYLTWTTTGVRVQEEGRCDNVKTVNVTARMQAI